MAATISTLVSNVTAPVNYVLMEELLTAARKNLPFFNGTLPGKLEGNKGSMSVKWRRIENLAPSTTALSEITGTAAAFLGRSAVQPTITDVTAAIAKYGNMILFTEELDLFNVNSRALQLMNTLGANAGESLNLLMQTQFDTATQIRYAGGAANDTAVAAAITLNDIKYSVNLLNRNSAMKFTPMATGDRNINTSTVRASYYGICHSDVEEDIRGLTGFIGVEQYGGYTEIEPSEFGAVGGVRWCSTEIATVATGIATTSVANLRGSTDILNDVYSTFVYGKEAVGSVGLGEMHAKEIYKMYDPKKPKAVELIKKDLGSSGIYDPYNEAGSLAWKVWFAGKILNNNWIVRLRTAATAL